MDDDERAELNHLWRQAKAGSRRAEATIVERYHWLSVKIARAKRVPSNITHDDLQSWANVGLFDAVRKFDPDSGDGQLHEHFIGYATLRINGSILDGMKAPGQSWATREVWRKLRVVHQTESALEQRLGRRPTRFETAAEMGVPVADLPVFQRQVNLSSPHLDPANANAIEIVAEAVTTEGSVEVANLAHRLAAKIVTLPLEAQELAAALFYSGSDVRDVVAGSGAPLARVRRQRSEMLLTLRDRLQRS